MSDTDDINLFKDNDHHIIELNIDVDSLPSTSPEMQHERRVAIFDLIEDNAFRPLESDRGPYILGMKLQGVNKLIFTITDNQGTAFKDVALSLTPFRRIVKDYFMICESYHNAIRTATSAQIEAIDMGRRGLHNEGSRLLTDCLRNQIDMDFRTSRRFFTLICALHRRNPL